MELRFILTAVVVIFGIAWIAFWVPRMRKMSRESKERWRRLEIEFGTTQALRLIRSLTSARSPEERAIYLMLMQKQYSERQGSTKLSDEFWVKTVDNYLGDAVRRSPEAGPKLRDFVQLGVAP